MKTHVRSLVTALVLTSTVAVATTADLPDRDEYAYRFPVELNAESDFFSVDVPLAVYRSVTDSSMRDAGVYNGAGQPVPRIFEHPAAQDTRIERSLKLGLVPLRGGPADQADQLRLLLRSDASGTTLELDAPETKGGPKSFKGSEKPLSAYILDLREPEQVFEALEFEWPRQPQGFIGTVTVEDSDDLSNWRRLGAATLAELQYGETLIERRRLNLARRTSDYLRVTWTNMPDTWSVLAVNGIYTGQGTQAAREWLTLDAVASAESGREFQFDAQGYPPTDRVNVLLPDDNVVVRASVFYRIDGQDRWRRAQSDIFYNISRQGMALRSEATEIRTVRASQWKIQFDSGATAGPVRLQLGWRPDRLLFVAQGSPPFELVTGRARDQLDKFPQHRMLGDNAIFGMLRESGQPGDALLGAREDLAGSAGLQISVTSRWRTALLWVGLAAAVALVGSLVFSLTREMEED